MCEILGFTAQNACDVTEYLHEFYRHSMVHSHGYGMIWQTDGVVRSTKEPLQASESTVLPVILKAMPKQTLTLAHIRYATEGAVQRCNCHPFMETDAEGRVWHFMHNGLVYKGDSLEKYRAVQHGSTDSERILLFMVDMLNAEIREKGMLSDAERIKVIERATVKQSAFNKLNYLLFDGELLYVHKNLVGTMYYKDLPDGVVIATSPLDKGIWKDFPMMALCVYKNGEKVYEGTPHGYEFIPNEDYKRRKAAMPVMK